MCTCTSILLAQIYSQTTPDIYRHFLLLSDQLMLCSDILSVHVSAHVSEWVCVRVCIICSLALCVHAQVYSWLKFTVRQHLIFTDIFYYSLINWCSVLTFYLFMFQHMWVRVCVCVVFLFGPNHFCNYKVLTRHSVCMGPSPWDLCMGPGGRGGWDLCNML